MSPRLLRSPARLASVSLLRAQTDERLVALARQGHEQAFATIVERYRTPLERYAARLVGPSRGEDAVQQAFVNAHSALTGESEKTIELRPWLYRIVHNTALNVLRSARDEVPLGEDAERIALSDDAIERRELLREALDAVAALPASQRDAILLRELEGRSHDEIAVALGVSPGAARQQIFRARAALRTAATALTPMPLMARLLEMATSTGGAGAADLATGAGAGLTAIIAKAGAGVLVTGAVVGGAVGTGVVHTPTHHRTPAAVEAAHVAAANAAGSTAASVASASAAHETAADVRRGHAGTRHESSSSTHRRHGKNSRGHHGSSSSGGSAGASHQTSSTTTHHSSSTSTPSHEDGGHRQSHSGGGSGESGSHHQSGKGGGTSGKHGAHHSPAATSTEAAEAPEAEVENEAAGDVSNKPADAGGAGGGKPADAGGAPTPAPADPAAATGGGGGGGGGGTSSGKQ